MSIKRFKTLIAVAELGTFAKAADAIYLTPAAVSQQMKALEAELGMGLFDRTKRPPELNPFGYALVPKAKELVRIYDSIKPSLSEKLDAVEHLTVGAVPTVMTGLVPRALKMLRNRFNNLHVRLFPSLSEDLYAQVDRGFLDAAILTEPSSVYDHLMWRPFTEEPLVLLTSNNVQESNPLAILNSHQFIRFSRKAWVGKLIDKWLIDNSIQVEESMELDSMESISAMVANDLGVSLVPKSGYLDIETEGLKIYPLSGKVPTRTLGVLCRKDTSKHKLVDLLLDELVTVVEK